jgi:hypothetical protein
MNGCGEAYVVYAPVVFIMQPVASTTTTTTTTPQPTIPVRSDTKDASTQTETVPYTSPEASAFDFHKIRSLFYAKYLGFFETSFDRA